MKRMCLILMVVFVVVACSSSSQTATPQHQTQKEDFCIENKPGRYAVGGTLIVTAIAYVVTWPVIAFGALATTYLVKEGVDMVEPGLWEKANMTSCRLT